MEATNTIYVDCHVPVYIMNNVVQKKKIKYNIKIQIHKHLQTCIYHVLYLPGPKTSLGLYVMEEGCLAAPEASVSEQ